MKKLFLVIVIFVLTSFSSTQSSKGSAPKDDFKESVQRFNKEAVNLNKLIKNYNEKDN